MHTSSVAAVAIVFAKYLGIVAPAVHSQCRVGPISVVGERLVAITLVLLLTAANIREFMPAASFKMCLLS
jgi:hypothetical protein